MSSRTHPGRNILHTTLLTLLSMGTLNAQPAAEDRAIGALVRNRCPGADILNIERSGSGLIEAEYLCGTVVIEVGILNGQVIYEEREAFPDTATLERITRTTEKQYPGWLLDDIELVTTSDTSFLKVEVILDGVEQNLFFTTTGRKYKPVAILISDGWGLSELRALEMPSLGYDLLAPDTVYELPDLLREVSGIALADERQLLCVQDELGAVFSYDLVEGRITDMIRFTDVGDFEDITVHNDRVTVLRSDGHLVELSLHHRKVLREQPPALPSLNHEGLFTDARTGDRYVVSKEAPVTGPADIRQVHRVLGDGTIEPYRTLSATSVAEALNRCQATLAQRGVRFPPSAAALHPITGALYVLSASDRLLVVFDEGPPLVHPLPADIFYKPEGIAFRPNGDMLISNEGDKKGIVKASLCCLSYGRN